MTEKAAGFKGAGKEMLVPGTWVIKKELKNFMKVFPRLAALLME
jgi:hypothetical protein